MGTHMGRHRWRSDGACHRKATSASRQAVAVQDGECLPGSSASMTCLIHTAHGQTHTQLNTATLLCLTRKAKPLQCWLPGSRGSRISRMPPTGSNRAARSLSLASSGRPCGVCSAEANASRPRCRRHVGGHNVRS